MEDIARRIEEMFMEAAFAAEIEIRHLKNISGRFTDWLDNHFTAKTFTEASEFDAAEDFMGGGPGGSKRTAGHCLPGFCTSRA
jgi:hypothetical protein